jgi:membrane fusion protein (multidrug efflux system)
MDEPTQTTPLPAPKPRRRIHPAYIVTALLAAALIGFAIFYYIRFVAPYETTDDAFIAGNVTFISPRVAGPVVRLLVNDNQRVKTGDSLIEIDPADFQTRLAEVRADVAVAQARLEQTKAQVAVDQAKVEQQQASLTAAEALAARAEADRVRYEAVQSQAISRSQLDLAKTEASSTAADVVVARSQVKAAAAQLEPDRANIAAAAAQVQQAQAALQQAELELSYTKVTAPRDGRVTRRTVEQGAYVQAGQNLLAIVPEDVWVVANFKETQLTHIRPGQAVTIKLDAYPGREFKGRVDSLQAGSGAEFSLLPPENAVGNYVKVVQRVPVKITFDEPLTDTNLDIAPGMSVEPKVRVQ